MKKFTKTRVLILLSFFISITVFSQSLETSKAKLEGCVNFDDLTVGDYVVEQYGGLWYSWYPGGEGDGIVSDLYSTSSPNSMLIEGSSDVVLKFNDSNLIQGKYIFSTNIYIPEGKTGYWNLQKDVVPGIEWGFQIMYEDDMTMVIDAGGSMTATPPYEYNIWYFNEIIVDLDNDWCQFYIDDVLIVEYQWTLGAFGTPGANTLGSVNFYANPGAGGTPPGAHFDDVCFEEYVPLENCDDFDELNVGGYVAGQLGGVWVTWSGLPTDDATVTDIVSHSPNNSFVVDAGTVDLIRILDDEPISTGQHIYSHYMYIPTGKSGYFNVQSEPTPGVEWVLELFFDSGGTGSFGSGSTETFTYEHDTWFLVKINFDLSSDLAAVYFDGMLMTNFEWDGTIGGIDYYGYDMGGPPGAYYDDVCFDNGWGPPPLLNPPTNLIATVTDCIIELSWDPPGGGTSEWIQWDAGINTGNGIGLAGNPAFYTASRWTPEELGPYDGQTITKISFFPKEADELEFELMVWTGEDAANLVLSQDVTNFTIDEFNIIELDSPITVDASQELWFGYKVTSNFSGFPAGCDDGPAVQEYGDLISLDGENWVSMSADYGLHYNWNLAAYVENDSESVLMQPKKDSKKSGIEDSKTLYGYNIYQKINNGAYYLLDFISSNNFMINASPCNDYYFIVTAVYDEGESDPSNEAVAEIPCYPPQNLIATIFENVNVHLVCDPPVCGTPSTYNFYHDGILIGENEIPEFDHINLDPGTYEYYATVSWGDEESEPSNVETVVIEPVLIESINSTKQIEIFPNPAKDFIHIKSQSYLNFFSIYSLTGNLIVSEKINKTDFTINTSGFEPGIYFIQIDTSEGSFFKRFVIR